MAVVKILIRDNDDGTLTLRVSSDPSFPGPAAQDQSVTAAQALGLRLLEHAKDMAAGAEAEKRKE